MNRDALLEKRAQLVAACEELATTNSVDSVSKFDAAEEEIRGIDAQLEGMAVRGRLDAIKAKSNAIVARPENRNGPMRFDMRKFADHMSRRDGTPLDIDMRTLNITTSTAGGNSTVTQQTGEFVKFLDWDNPIRTLATTQLFPTNLDIPVIANRTTVTAVGESGEYSASDLSMTKKSFVAYKAAAYTDVTEELLNDSVVDVAAQVVDDHARAHAKYRSQKHAVGTGSAQEQGIFGEARWQTNIYTAGNTTVQSWNEVIQLYGAIRPGYLANASWVMNPQTWVQLLDDRDGAGGSVGKYIYDGMTGNFLKDGGVGMIFGKPVYLTEFAPTFGGATDKTVIFFGDLKRAYRIVDRTNVTFRVNPYIRSINGEVRYESVMRSDAQIVDSYAGGVITCGTA